MFLTVYKCLKFPFLVLFCWTPLGEIEVQIINYIIQPPSVMQFLTTIVSTWSFIIAQTQYKERALQLDKYKTEQIEIYVHMTGDLNQIIN